MRIIVCIKRVTHYAIDSSQTLLTNQTDFRVKLNPQDLIALEEALTLREKRGGEVIALSLSTPAEELALRRALTTGADRAIAVGEPLPSQADWHMVSFVLAKAAKEVGFDLILCGTRHFDKMEEAVGPGIAENLGIPVVTHVVKVEVLGVSSGVTLRVSRKLPRGMRETYELCLPCLVTVADGLNQPRYVPILGKYYRQGLLKPVEHLPISALNINSTVLSPKVRVIVTGEMKTRVRLGVKVSGCSLEDKLRLLGWDTSETTQKRELIVRDHKTAVNKIVKKLSEWLGEKRT